MSENAGSFAVLFEGIDGEWWPAYEESWPIRAGSQRLAVIHVRKKMRAGGEESAESRMVAVPWSEWEPLSPADTDPQPRTGHRGAGVLPKEEA